MTEAMSEATVRQKTDLRDLPYPKAFDRGAENAVVTCLRVQPEEKVTLIADRSCREIAASLAVALDHVGCRWNAFVLEEIASRPCLEMPFVVLDDMEARM